MTSSPSVLQRVIFPLHGDPQSLPLFLDPETWSWTPLPETDAERLGRKRGMLLDGFNRRPTRLTSRGGLRMLNGRRGLILRPFSRVSLATYFNAFPASYWKAWTSVDRVTLSVTTVGPGRVIVFRSNARGVIQRVDGRDVDGAATSVFEIPLVSFLDGGWLWFDLVADESPFELVEADWSAADGIQPREAGTATVSITTLNRGDYCTRLLAEIGADKDVLGVLDRVQVIDQGTQRLVDNPGYPGAQDALEGKLRVIEQANIGGSGGFSRGMLETIDAGVSSNILLLDDDVEIEPESIRRAVQFSNYCLRPTIVGGHMFDMYDKARLHAFAEGIQPSSFMWGPFTPERHDFGESNLRQTRWLHRRYDVDYNGWWMSLIPVSLLKQAGLSLPVFIKWDDAEYSLRAREHGVSTVSLPGAAVWHVSWVDKDDTHEWQAFFHVRNRLIAALLHSSQPRGGKLWRSTLATDVKNLLTMDYFTVTMHLDAIRNVLEGPEQLHDDMVTRLPRLREQGRSFRESTLIRDAAQLPRFPARENLQVTTGRFNPGPSGPRFVPWVLRQLIRHARPVTSDVSRPHAHLSYQDARWFEVPTYDSVLISNAEGSGASWHVRDPRQFRRLLREAVRLHLRYRREWPQLSARYQEALPQITSPERWRRTIEANSKPPQPAD